MHLEKQLYRTEPVQNMVNLAPFYTDLLKIGLNRTICLENSKGDSDPDINSANYFPKGKKKNLK